MSDERVPGENPLWSMTKVIAAAAAISLVFLLIMRYRPEEPTGGLAPGKTPPAIEAEGWINGPAPGASDLAGKVLVIDAWATWCMPCRAKAPHLVELYQKYADQGVVFLGLTDQKDEELPAIQEFLLSSGISWPNGYGAEKTLTSLGHITIPAVWVVGRDGVIVWNSDSSGDVEDGIRKALAN